MEHEPLISLSFDPACFTLAAVAVALAYRAYTAENRVKLRLIDSTLGFRFDGPETGQHELSVVVQNLGLPLHAPVVIVRVRGTKFPDLASYSVTLRCSELDGPLDRGATATFTSRWDRTKAEISSGIMGFDEPQEFVNDAAVEVEVKALDHPVWVCRRSVIDRLAGRWNSLSVKLGTRFPKTAVDRKGHQVTSFDRFPKLPEKLGNYLQIRGLFLGNEKGLRSGGWVPPEESRAAPCSGGSVTAPPESAPTPPPRSPGS